MGTPPISDAQRAAILAVRLVAGSNNSEAAHLLAPYLGLQPIAVRQQLYHFDEDEATERLLELCTPKQPEAMQHDIRFWRERASQLERQLGEADRLAQELAGVAGQEVDPPEWVTRVSGETGKSVLICHTSDLHMGEVIRADEISGVNAYSPAVAVERMRRYYDAACEIGRRWTADTECQGVLHTMGGDETSGDIHHELSITNALTSHEQVEAAAELRVAGIRQLADEYGRVHVAAVPGNHGRTTMKPTAKRYAALSYDILVAKMVAREMRDDARVTFQIAAGKDCHIPVLGWQLMLTHGDKIGTRGGMGFAGPVLPIVRGAHKINLSRGRVDRAPDLILMGHYHTSAAPPGILANGSVPGYSEYGDDMRFVPEPPKQWLALWTAKWGLRERLDVQLEPPRRPKKPRITIAAEMARV